MKQALEALEEYQSKGAPFQSCDAAADVLRQAIADAEQAQPVAWLENLTDPQPHAVTNLRYCSKAQHQSGDHLKYIPVYTAPPLYTNRSKE